jgi:predicted small lipoprotein YifL
MRSKPVLRSVLGVAAVLASIAGCGPAGPSGVPSSATPSSTMQQASTSAGAVTWARPADASAAAVAAGLKLEVKEHLANHVHAHLDVFVDGQPVEVPAGIGINIEDPEVKRFDDPGGVSYSGIQECGQPCISPLHTHDSTGILHTESPVSDLHTLGQFFDEWGVALTDSCVGEFCSPKPIAIYIDGQQYSGDPRAIELADLREIAVIVGTPPAVIPNTADFSMA